MNLEFRRRENRIKALSLVSLIDVILLLVIYFLLAGHLEKFEVLDVQLPIADSGKVLNVGEIVILLGKHNEVVVNDELVDVDDLGSTVKQAMKGYARPVISVKADSEMEAIELIRVMDILRATGGDYISLVTQSFD